MEKADAASITLSGETIPEKDPKIPADKEKIIEAEVLKVGADSPAVVPVAPAANQSKDSGAGPYTIAFEKYLSGEEAEFSKQPADPQPHWFTKEFAGPVTSGSGKEDSPSHKSSYHHKGSHGSSREHDDEVIVRHNML